jgi:hypothetical protein
MIADIDEDLLLLPENFDKALIGFIERAGMEPVALYDREIVLRVFMDNDGMSMDEATEWFEYNVLGSYIGVGTPAFATIWDDQVTEL